MNMRGLLWTTSNLHHKEGCLAIANKELLPMSAFNKGKPFKSLILALHGTGIFLAVVYILLWMLSSIHYQLIISHLSSTAALCRMDMAKSQVAKIKDIIDPNPRNTIKQG